MSHQSSSAQGEIEKRDSQKLRRGTLGVLGIAFFVVSAAAPLTAMAGGAPVAMLYGNGAGIPAAYVVVSVLLLIFSVGYTTMARHHTSTGAFYSYITRGLKQPTGGASAIIAVLGYNCMSIGLYGLFGAAAAGFASDHLGIDMAWYVYVFIAMAIVGLCGYRQVDLSVKVLVVLVTLEFLIVLILDLMILVKGGEGGKSGISLSPFSWDSFTSGSITIALLFNFAAFIGFEATTLYSEEAKDPKRTVPRATYVAVLTIGLFYTVTTWLMVNGQGAVGLQDFLGGLKPDPTAFLFVLGDTYMGSSLTTLMSLLFVSSVFAALLAFHNAVARYLFALGREGLVPSVLGRTHPKHQSPHVGSLAQTTLAFVVVLVFVLADKDPVLELFTWLTNLGTLAILVLMSLSSFAVIAFFAANRGLDSNLWRTVIAPAIGGIGMGLVAVYAAAKFGLLLGNPESSLRWILPALIVVAAVVGLGAALRLKSVAPQMYAQMGRNRSDDGTAVGERPTEAVG
ncbi:APC family permease [Angustibacter luteus]|uniref:APC family permease n=1 Tax=Angustibacter luteus TaxID=658456 RepID=A0ABW1JDS0_9ACTN